MASPTAMEGPATFYEAMHTDRIMIVVGSSGNEKTFIIPRDIIAEDELFPRDLLLQQIPRNPQEAITLPDDSPVAFTNHQFYLYHHKVQFPELPAHELERLETQLARDQYVHELCQTWVFGDKYSVPGLQNCAMYRLCEVLPLCNMAFETMKYCYDYTKPTSKLRNLVVDHIVAVQHEMRKDANPAKIKLLGALSIYHGFKDDLYGVQKVFYARAGQDKSKLKEFPEYLRQHLKLNPH